MITKSKHIDSYQFLKTITFRKVLNGLVLRLSYHLSKLTNTHIHWGKPESLSIEPTNLCNLKCPECPSGNNSMTRSRVFLSEENFTNALNIFSPWLSNLILYFQGEPFMHPKIYDFIQQASKHKIYTSTSTNGQFLSVENSEKIVSSGLKRIIVSIDGTDQQTFEKYRVGGSLDLAIQGIKNLKLAKEKFSKPYPYIVIQFVVFSTNEHQVSEVKQLAKKLGVNLILKSAQIENFEQGNTLIPKNNKYSRYSKDKNNKFHLKRKNNFKCWRVWSGSVISAENKLLPCCFDKNAEYSYGNSSIQNWKNYIAINFRKSVWNERSIEMCKNCSEGVKPININLKK